jgi:hypothetical protein
VEFYHVTLTAQTELKRTDGQTARDSDTGARFIRAFVCPLVQNISLSRKLIFAPDLLDVNERALSLAKD